MTHSLKLYSALGTEIQDFESISAFHDFSPGLHFELPGGFGPELIDKSAVGLWRYQKSYPLNALDSLVTLGEVVTPLLSRSFGGVSVSLKVDFLFPTGSYKDRGAAVLLNYLSRQAPGAAIVEDSSGNAGAAIAAYAAACRMPCTIVAVAGASPAKLRQIEAAGAKLKRIQGSREAVAREARIMAETSLYASHVYHPAFLSGMQSFIFEVWEQMDFSLPETLVLPVGNGTLLLGCWYGLKALHAATGIQIPRIIGVQATGCPGLVNSAVQNPQTRAEGIACASPFRRDEILKAISASGGEVILVTDEAIEQAGFLLAKSGWNLEFTGGVAMAGWLQLGRPCNSLIPLTGSGLKSS